jgi:hypothetical protein
MRPSLTASPRTAVDEAGTPHLDVRLLAVVQRLGGAVVAAP